MTNQARSITARQRTKALIQDLSNANADPATCELIARAVNAIHYLLDEVDRLSPNERTETQSASRWIYLTQLATALNDAGFDKRAVLHILKTSKQIDVANTKDSLYEDYWLSVQRALFDDIKRPDTKQIQQIYENMNRHTAETFGISIAWPDRFNRGRE